MLLHVFISIFVISFLILSKQELEDLAELAERRERLLDRARHRSAVNVHELRKVEADVPPVPARVSA